MPVGPATETDQAAGATVGRAILIDALAARFGGTAYAAVQLARHLAQRPEVARVAVVARSGSIVERGLAGDENVTSISLPGVSRFELIRRTAWESLRLPTLAATQHYDVVISMSGMLPRPPGCRVICLILNPVMYEKHTPANIVRRWAVRLTARHADYLVAPTRYVADLVSASTRRECVVMPLGVDHGVFAPASDPGSEILCVADFYAHKRHDLILKAWLLLPSPRPRLRFVGDPAADPEVHARLVAQIESLPDANSISLERGISLERLVESYHRARLFVIASERESFCMPLVESMACGVPAVARGLASLRETGGAGARYIDGNDPTHWAATLRRLIEDDVEHACAREAAVNAAARFSWTLLAAELTARF
jgi:glycosyltransferase involved in cell wall biosynthesis